MSFIDVVMACSSIQYHLLGGLCSFCSAGLDDAVAERYLRIVHRDIMIMQESLKGESGDIQF